MDTEPVDQSRVLVTGLEHDRGWAVRDDAGAVVTARTAPALRDVRALVPHGPDDGPALLLPSSGLPVRGPSADGALSELLGRPVRLHAAEGAGIGFNQVAAVLLVSRQALGAPATEAEPSDRSDRSGLSAPACVPDDSRANVVVDLAGTEGDETSWVGHEVHLGEVVLRVTHTPKHCLGVYADVVRPGTLRVGDDVRLS